MKPDERALFVAVFERCPRGSLRLGQDSLFPGDIAAQLGIAPKRAQFLFEKWTDKGLFTYGVSARTGWLEAKGIALAQELLAEARHA